MSTEPLRFDEDRRLFADFALRETGHPASPDQPEGEAAIAADIMRLSLESLRDYLRLTAGARRADGTAFRAYAGYVETIDIGGVSGTDAGLHFCGVTLGLTAACYELANFCLAQKDLFPDIGDPDKEVSPAPLEGTVPGFWMRGRGKRLRAPAFIRRGRTYLPRCSERETKALLLAVLMLRVVWFHELAHCLNGHVGWSGDAHGLTCLLEGSGPATRGNRTCHEMPLFEYDADQTALVLACKLQIGEAENITGLQRMTLAQRLHWTLFAAYVVTLILAEYQRAYPTTTEDTHPPPEKRLLNQIRTVASNVVPLAPEVQAANAAACADLGRLSARVPRFPSIDAVTGFGGSNIEEALDEAQAALEGLRTRLQGFAFRAGSDRYDAASPSVGGVSPKAPA